MEGDTRVLERRWPLGAAVSFAGSSTVHRIVAIVRPPPGRLAAGIRIAGGA